MKLEFKDWLVVAQIVVTLIGMIVGPWLAVRWSLKRFRTEKWWERQQETYRVLLENLSVVKSYYANKYEAIIQGDGYEPGADIDEQLRKVCYDLEKHSATGAYLISTVAAEALRKYIRESDVPYDCPAHEAVGKLFDAANSCIEVLKVEAKKGTL